MGILSRSADLVYSFRFLRLLTTAWTDTTAYKLGIIDDKGARDKSVKVDTTEKKSAYNSFHKLVFNIKRLMAKVPGGGSKVATYAAALFLLKEHGKLSTETVDHLIEKMDIDVRQMTYENDNWLLTADQMLSPGLYRVTGPKIVNTTCEEIVKARDQIRVKNNCYPIDHVAGIPVFEATHLNSGLAIYVTAGELNK